MADSGNINTMLNGIQEPGLKQIFVKLFEYLLKDIRFGRAINGDPAKNFGGGFFSGRTSATPDQEFTVAHSFGRAPYLAIPVLPLNTVNAYLPRLNVSRAADSNRIYLSSPDADAAFFLYLEG
jgi:hypothetical protein